MNELLRRLDERILPPLADALSRRLRTAGQMRTFTIGAGVVAALLAFVALYATTRTSGADDGAVGSVVRVGVDEGDSVPAYVAGSDAQLLALPPTAEVYALVSFTAYLAPDRLTDPLAPVSVSSVFARVPLPHTQTELVRLGAYQIPGDVESAMEATADRKDDDAADYRRRAAKAARDPQAAPSVYAVDAAVASAEATAYRQHCSCVYAAVVHGSPAQLRAVAQRPEVRVVDPAAEVRQLDRTVFLPPLPEQTGTVGPASDVGL